MVQRLTKTFGILVLGTLAMLGCRPFEKARSNPDFTVGGASPSECGPITDGTVETIGCLIGTVGHEHILRIAEMRAEGMTQSLHYAAAKTEIQEGSGGDSSKDDLVIGNYSTDKPIFVDEFDLAQWHQDLFGVDKAESWHEGGHRQMFHSLVNFTKDDESPSSLASRGDSCKAVRNVIVSETRKGLDLIKAGREREGLRLIGSATHTIQDSFSRAHTVRTKIADVDDGNYFKYRIWSLDRFCKYGKAVPGVCEHKLAHDFIVELGPLGGSFKPEARAATDTTTAYLVYVHWIEQNKMSFDKAMNDFFNGSNEFLTFARNYYTTQEERMVVTVGNFDCME